MESAWLGPASNNIRRGGWYQGRHGFETALSIFLGWLILVLLPRFHLWWLYTICHSYLLCITNTTTYHAPSPWPLTNPHPSPVPSSFDGALLQEIVPCAAAEDVEPDGGRQQRAEDMAWKERLMHTLHLWPYMLPLCAVYFAEYAMQTGTWTAIGLSSRTAVSDDCTPRP